MAPELMLIDHIFYRPVRELTPDAELLEAVREVAEMEGFSPSHLLASLELATDLKAILLDDDDYAKRHEELCETFGSYGVGDTLAYVAEWLKKPNRPAEDTAAGLIYLLMSERDGHAPEYQKIATS